MPSHPDRVAKNYEHLCTRCLKHRNNYWDDESSHPNWCDGCIWREYIKNGRVNMPNENIQRILDRYPI